MTSEIVLYQPDDTIQLEVRLQDETVWLSQQQMAELFGTDRTSILRHIHNVYKTHELEELATCAKIAQVRLEGNRQVMREIRYLPYYEYSKKYNYTIHHFYYDLDMFECYMEATDIYMFDNLVDVDYDYLDYQEPSGDCGKAKDFTYRLVVRDNYNIFQILRLKMMFPEPVLVEAID